MANSCSSERFIGFLCKTGVVLLVFACVCYIVQVHNEISLENESLRREAKNLTKRVQELEAAVGRLLRDKMVLDSQSKAQTVGADEKPKGNAVCSRQEIAEAASWAQALIITH